MQLNLKTMFERAEAYFPRNEVVSRRPDGSRFRYTYGDFCKRTRKLASRLGELGVKPGERVATIAWNDYRHLELYFAIPCAGMTLHTVNLRLSEDHLTYIMNHAEDRVVFLPPDMVPVVEAVAPRLKSVKMYVVMDDKVPETSLSPVMSYEELVASGDENFPFEELDEYTPAAMCYTSATTGNPKGVIYTHRGLYLHSLMIQTADVFAISEKDKVLPVVPMFHVNAWGLPFTCVWLGAPLILPGTRPTPRDVLELITDEKPTVAAGAVTIGIDMLKILSDEPGRYDISSLRGLLLGGQATPKAIMEQYLNKYGVRIFTAWGATETAPIATCTQIKRHQLDLPIDEQLSIRERQGIPVAGSQIKILSSEGQPVAWNDQEIGEVYARAPWIATTYYNDERSKESFEDEFWKSGDMATVNEEGVMRLVDRAKDLIKSGGEWISSVDLENALMAHPDILEACVVAMPHEKWIERPIAFVVAEGGKERELTQEALTKFLEPRFARWWLPDRFIVVPEIPKTGVGKFNKKALREDLPTYMTETSGQAAE